MSEHYFESNPTVKSNQNLIHYKFHDRPFTFVTDTGVFSKKTIDFGSRLMIENMIIHHNSTVLDVGCGYGPIGIVAASLCSAGHVTMLDINQRAIELTKMNAKQNEIGNVTIVQSDLLSALNGQTYDIVLTNPPIRAGKVVVHEIFTQAYKHLADGGFLWVVIQKKQGASSTFKKLSSLFSTVDVVVKEKGYMIYLAHK